MATWALPTNGSIFNTTAGNKSTGTVTPVLNDLWVVVTAHTGYTGTGAPADDNPDGLGAYTQVGSNALKVASADRLQVWVRNALIGSTTGTVVSHTGLTTTGGGVILLALTGMTKTGATAVRGSGLQSNQVAGGTPAPVLPAAATGTNPLLGCVFCGVNPATMTKPASFDTEQIDGGYQTPVTGIEVVSDDTGNTDTTVTWGSAVGGSTQWCSFVVEFDASGSGATSMVFKPYTRRSIWQMGWNGR